MMADGGFSVEGQENLQEILSKRLYLCQFAVALGIVREGKSCLNTLIYCEQNLSLFILILTPHQNQAHIKQLDAFQAI